MESYSSANLPRPQHMEQSQELFLLSWESGVLGPTVISIASSPQASCDADARAICGTAKGGASNFSSVSVAESVLSWGGSSRCSVASRVGACYGASIPRCKEISPSSSVGRIGSSFPARRSRGTQWS